MLFMRNVLSAIRAALLHPSGPVLVEQSDEWEVVDRHCARKESILELKTLSMPTNESVEKVTLLPELIAASSETLICTLSRSSITRRDVTHVNDGPRRSSP